MQKKSPAFLENYLNLPVPARESASPARSWHIFFWKIKNTLMAKQNIKYPLCIFYTSHPVGTKHHRSPQEERGSGSSRTILTTIIIPPPPSLGHRGRAEEGAPLRRGGGRKRRKETLRYRPSTRTVFPLLCLPLPQVFSPDRTSRRK